ncbi:unnamed protein product [Closterium sp. Naga37s-1]|nr:unnamed protein product [Closterium sp. Naga37s-1]
MSNDLNSIRQRFREVQEDDMYLSQELERIQRQREEEAQREAKLDFRGLRLYRELTATSEPMHWRENPEKTETTGAKPIAPAAGNPGNPPGGNMWSYSSVAPSSGSKRQYMGQPPAAGVTFYGANGGGKSGRVETYESAVKGEESEGKKAEGKKSGGGFASWLMGGADHEQHLLWDKPEFKEGEIVRYGLILYYHMCELGATSLYIGAPSMWQATRYAERPRLQQVSLTHRGFNVEGNRASACKKPIPTLVHPPHRLLPSTHCLTAPLSFPPLPQYPPSHPNLVAPVGL